MVGVQEDVLRLNVEVENSRSAVVVEIGESSSDIYGGSKPEFPRQAPAFPALQLGVSFSEDPIVQ